MPGDPLQHVRPGQRFAMPAAAYNAFVDAAKAHRDGRITTATSTTSAPPPNSIVLIKNESGADAPRGGCLGIDEPLFLPEDALASFLAQPAFRCSAPQRGTHDRAFVVLIEPIADGAMGRACLDGLCLAKIDAGETPVAAAYADIADDEVGFLAPSACGAAQVLWQEPGMGERWALVRLGAAAFEVFIEITDHTANGTERWVYDFKVKEPDPQAVGAFVDADPELTHLQLGHAHNLAEFAESNFERGPIPDGTICLARMVGAGPFRFPVILGVEFEAEDCGEEAEEALDLAAYVGLLDAILVDGGGDVLLDAEGAPLTTDDAGQWPAQEAMLSSLYVGDGDALLTDARGDLVHDGGVDGVFDALMSVILTDANGDPLSGAAGDLLIGDF